MASSSTVSGPPSAFKLTAKRLPPSVDQRSAAQSVAQRSRAEKRALQHVLLLKQYLQIRPFEAPNRSSEYLLSGPQETCRDRWCRVAAILARMGHDKAPTTWRRTFNHIYSTFVREMNLDGFAKTAADMGYHDLLVQVYNLTEKQKEKEWTDRERQKRWEQRLRRSLFSKKFSIFDFDESLLYDSDDSGYHSSFDDWEDNYDDCLSLSRRKSLELDGIIVRKRESPSDSTASQKRQKCNNSSATTEAVARDIFSTRTSSDSTRVHQGLSAGQPNQLACFTEDNAANGFLPMNTQTTDALAGHNVAKEPDLAMKTTKPEKVELLTAV